MVIMQSVIMISV